MRYGHGGFTIGKTKVQAHRAAYALTHGFVPPDLEIRHKCDNPPCCNPAHLEPGTHKQNMEDRKNRGRNAPKTGSLNGRARLTEDDVRYIRSQSGKKLQRELGAEFGVPQRTVSDILLRKTWRHI